MNLDAVIAQLRAEAPSFADRVAGAANFADAMEGEVALALPAAYVIPLEEEASENDSLNGLRQLVTERIGVVLHLDNAVANGGDRRGQAPVASVDALRLEVFAAILNWAPAGSLAVVRGLEYAGAQLLKIDRARVFYQLEFTLEATLTDSDGYQAPNEPLEEIDVIVTSADGATTIAGGSADNLQD